MFVHVLMILTLFVLSSVRNGLCSGVFSNHNYGNSSRKLSAGFLKSFILDTYKIDKSNRQKKIMNFVRSIHPFILMPENDLNENSFFTSSEETYSTPSTILEKDIIGVIPSLTFLPTNFIYNFSKFKLVTEDKNLTENGFIGDGNVNLYKSHKSEEISKYRFDSPKDSQTSSSSSYSEYKLPEKSTGRVSISVFRGPNTEYIKKESRKQSVARNYFAPWGYFMTQPVVH